MSLTVVINASGSHGAHRSAEGFFGLSGSNSYGKGEHGGNGDDGSSGADGERGQNGANIDITSRVKDLAVIIPGAPAVYQQSPVTNTFSNPWQGFLVNSKTAGSFSEKAEKSAQILARKDIISLTPKLHWFNIETKEQLLSDPFIYNIDRVGRILQENPYGCITLAEGNPRGGLSREIREFALKYAHECELTKYPANSMPDIFAISVLRYFIKTNININAILKNILIEIVRNKAADNLYSEQLKLILEENYFLKKSSQALKILERLNPQVSDEECLSMVTLLQNEFQPLCFENLFCEDTVKEALFYPSPNAKEKIIYLGRLIKTLNLVSWGLSV